MRIKKNYTKEEVLSAVEVGIEFEFYADDTDMVKAAKSISKYIGKRIVVPVSLDKLNKEKPLYHSPVKPTDSIFKLEPDNSGGKKMRELITGPLGYKEARDVIIKVLEWISNNGYTNNRCAIQLNIGVDNKKLPTIHKVQTLPVSKFILSFDENKVYKEFPDREGSVYARSIKQLNFNNILFYTPTMDDFSANSLTLPNDDKYYGVNFLKAKDGYLEYRYLGGEGYEKKTRKILEILEYFSMHLYETLNSSGLSEKEVREFKKMTEAKERVYKGFVKFEVFKSMFPDIKVSVDMNTYPEVVESFWGNIRETIYKLIVSGGLKKGEYNYDTEVGRHQLQNSKLTNCKVNGVEFINCEIEGIFEHSWFYECKLKNSRVTTCEFLKNNQINSCRITESILHPSNVCDNCYIANKKILIDCEVKGGVIRSGEIGKLAKVSKETYKV